MRNLEVSREKWSNVSLENGDSGEGIVAAAYDAGHDRLFLASDALIIYHFDFSSQQSQRIISLVEEVFSEEPWFSEGDRILCMEFLVEKEALVLAIEEKGIILLDPASLEVEEICTPTGGLVTLSLSPHGELLLYVTGDGQLHVMTQDWDWLYDISLDQPPGCRRSGLISPGVVQVSWRGDGKYFSTLENDSGANSEGQGHRSSSIKVWETETGALHSVGEPLSHVQPALSWSPGGARIATVCCRPATGETPLVVLFERNGLKRSSFDVLAPPEAKVESLQWNANSELLVVLMRCGEKDLVQVWNMRNFHWYLKQEWQFSALTMIKVFWDPEKPLQLLCWTTSGCVGRIMLCWKNAVIGGSTAFVIDGKHLLITSFSHSVVPPPMCMFKVNFPSALQRIASLFEDASRCLIAAILSDGSFSVVVLPGVEAWDDLEGADISALLVQSDPVLDFGQVRHVLWVGSNTLVGSISCDAKPCVKDALEMGSATGMVHPLDRVDLGSEYLFELELEPKDGAPECFVGKSPAFSTKWLLKLVTRKLLDQPMFAIVRASSSSHLEETCGTKKSDAYLQLTDGSVVVYSPCGGNQKPQKHGGNIGPSLVKFVSPSPWMHAIIHGDGEGEVVLIALDEHGRLQVNDQLVSSDCTSFTTHESFAGNREHKVSHLIFTTRLDTLNVMNLEEILSGIFSGEVNDISSLSPVRKPDRPTTLVGKSRASKVSDVCNGGDTLRIRPLWERGAQLVAAIGGTDTAVILQTIRGNLETIFPRGLVLGAIAAALTQDNFKDAVLLVRRHRINLNVVVDYKGWEEFSLAASFFVKQVSLAHITEVVQALNNENIMETTYKNLIPVYKKLILKSEIEQLELSSDSDPKNKMGVSNPNSKVRGVLNAIRFALEKEAANSPARELCILTTLARSDPPELEAALDRIKGLRDAEIRGMNDGNVSLSKDNLSAEAAVKHLIWLTDGEVVFHAALALYDLHLAAIVAAHSQRDPKEFLPLLENLEKMPAAEMKYNIDCRLGRFESALQNCAEIGEDHFDKCIQLVKDHPSLFACGLKMFKEGEKKRVLLDAWGDYLVDEGKFEDAGAAFCACLQFDKALSAYRLGGLWESVMTMAGRVGKTSAEIRELATEVRDELQAMGRPRDAAKLALDYCSDVEGAITLLLDAHAWLEVARLAYLHGKRDLIPAQLEPAVLESASSEVGKLGEGVEKVGKYLARFLIIRQQRMLLAAKLKGDEDNRGAIENDASSDISLANSTQSTVSGLSGLSAYSLGGSRSHSTTSSVSGKRGRRQARSHKSDRGTIRAGSVGEELALVQHVKGMAIGGRSLEEHHVLLEALVQLGHESTARQLHQAISWFTFVQKDAVEKMLDGTVTEELILTPSNVHWQWEILK